jgi:maleylacetoacetate isomerase
VKLYQRWLSSASWRVRWALALKRLQYESVWLDIAAGEHFDKLAPINPLLSVPTLVLDDGDVLTESVAIIEWLDETYPERPLLPATSRDRARVRA